MVGVTDNSPDAVGSEADGAQSGRDAERVSVILKEAAIFLVLVIVGLAILPFVVEAQMLQDTWLSICAAVGLGK